MLSNNSDRRVFAYMEGFTTCAAFAALGTLGLLDELAVNGLRVTDVGTDRFLADATLRYLAQRDVLRPAGDVYELTDLGRQLYDDRAYLIWLSGGYGEGLHWLGDMLTGRLRFGVDVDRDMRWVALGTAIAGQKELRPEMMALLEEIDFKTVADVGCGNAHLLITLCRAAGGEGIGIDVSCEAIDEARREVERAGLSDRIEIVQSDARDLSLVPGLERVDLVLAFFFLHEVLEHGYEVLVDYLRGLAERLPVGAHVLAAEITPPESEYRATEVFSPEYILTQAFLHQTMLSESGWTEAFAAADLEVTRVVLPSLPETRLILARKMLP